MTCEECLSELATGSLRDLPSNSAVMQHCATCPDCSRLTTLLRDREYEAATVLNNLPPMSNPLAIAEASVLTAQRRRVGRVAVMVSGAALAATIWFTAAIFVFPTMRSDVPATLLTETIPLSCLSPRQAADIIDPYVRTHGSLYFIPTSGISAITVRGTPAQLRKSKDLIREFETDPNAACRVSPTAHARTLPGVQDQPGRATPGNAEPVIATDKVPTAPKK
jgi:hypothetical protein